MAGIDSGAESSSASQVSCSPTPVYADHLHSDNAVRDRDPHQHQRDANISNHLAPPNIQPYSGVLEQGKVVIKPIAFKASPLTTTRFDVAGERYGSTPVLTRPGSRITVYGSSNDLRPIHATHNHSINSLDRKLRSSCISSPTLQMASLMNLPHHKLKSYSSLETIRNSPMQQNCNNYPSYSSLRHDDDDDSDSASLTPSPSDSGISDLSAALRDRDSELAHLRQTMEHNEQVIFRVYQEKERSWERELRRLKLGQDHRQMALAQRVAQLERLIRFQRLDYQEDKRRLCTENNRVQDVLQLELRTLKERLEDTEWRLCQKTGEMVMLKNQLRDLQNEQKTKAHELLQTRSDHKESLHQLDNRDKEIIYLKSVINERDGKINDLFRTIDEIKHQNDTLTSKTNENGKLKQDLQELRKELSEMSMKEYRNLEAGRAKRPTDEASERQQLDVLKRELENRKAEFDRERIVWIEEKEKVLRYQKQLQMNYIQMYRRTRTLEAEVESLNVELELDKTGYKKKLASSSTCLPIEL